jgi:hypothetical protein
MWFNFHPSLQPQRHVTFLHAYVLRLFTLLDTFKVIYVLTMTRNLSSASGLGAAKVLRGSMTASATSSCIRTTAHSLVTVAGNPLRGLMRSIVTVRDFPTAPFYIAILTGYPLFSTLGGWLRLYEESRFQHGSATRLY